LSCFVLTDGSYKILPTAKDYKRIGEGDTGLNTAEWELFPVPYVDDFDEKIETRIVKPTIEGFQKMEFHTKVLFLLLIK
jgi:phosphoribosylamine--glycine ligase